jgi:hypothetical protein
MNKESIETSVTKRVPAPIMAAIWIFAVGAPALVLHFQSLHSARHEAEAAVLTEVAAAINSASHRREVILERLATGQNATNDVRYVRACRRLGYPTDWFTLFARVATEGKNTKAKAARIIAEECQMEAGATLKVEESALVLDPLKARGRASLAGN